MAISPLLQIRTMMRRRSSADVSLGYLSVLLVGFVLWLAYGLAITNAALIVTNVTSLTVGVTTILVARHFRDEDRQDQHVDGVVGMVGMQRDVHEPPS